MRGAPLPEEIPSHVRLPRHWKVVTLVTSPWPRRVPNNVTDMIVEEEREDSMETDTPLDSAAPALLKEKAISEDLEAEVKEDRCSQTSEESTDQNPPHDSDPDEDKLVGPPADISVHGGHSDDSIALVVSPGDDDL